MTFFTDLPQWVPLLEISIFISCRKSDELIKQALLVETDESKANQLYQEIQQQLHDKSAVPLVEYTVPEVQKKRSGFGI